MAKVQMESKMENDVDHHKRNEFSFSVDLRQAERQVPLSKRFGMFIKSESFFFSAHRFIFNDCLAYDDL